MIYLRRASPLHATRAAVASAWCVVLALVALSFEHPLVLARAARRCRGRRRGRARRRGASLLALAFALPFALLVGLVNPLVVRDGLTVIARLGTVPVLGAARHHRRGDRVRRRARRCARSSSIGCFALHSAAVDPDDLLRAFRRISFRSALTAALATRLVPVLGARRPAAARRAALPRGRAGAAPRDRARGRGGRARPRRRRRGDARGARLRRRAARRRAAAARPWSRHDLAFAASAVALAAVGDRRTRRRHARRSPPTRRSARPSAREQLGLCAVLARLRAAAVRRPPGDRAVSAALRLERVTYRYPDAEAPALRDIDLDGRAGRVRRARGRRRARASRRCCARRPGSCRTSTAASSAAGWSPAGSTRARTSRPRSPRSPGRCSRTPRRRS